MDARDYRISKMADRIEDLEAMLAVLANRLELHFYQDEDGLWHAEKYND